MIDVIIHDRSSVELFLSEGSDMTKRKVNSGKPNLLNVLRVHVTVKAKSLY